MVYTVYSTSTSNSADMLFADMLFTDIIKMNNGTLLVLDRHIYNNGDGIGVSVLTDV